VSEDLQNRHLVATDLPGTIPSSESEHPSQLAAAEGRHHQGHSCCGQQSHLVLGFWIVLEFLQTHRATDRLHDAKEKPGFVEPQSSNRALGHPSPNAWLEVAISIQNQQSDPSEVEPSNRGDNEPLENLLDRCGLVEIEHPGDQAPDSLQILTQTGLHFDQSAPTSTHL